MQLSIHASDDHVLYYIVEYTYPVFVPSSSDNSRPEATGWIHTGTGKTDLKIHRYDITRKQIIEIKL